MNTTRFDNGIREIKAITMTDAEKRRIFGAIVSAAPGAADAPRRKVPVRSPWSVYSFGVWIGRHAAVSIAAIAILLLGTGSGLVSAAEGAVPGDALYPLKVSVAEPLRGVFAQAPAAKAAWEAEKAERRLQEAETLAAQGRLDTGAQAQLAVLFDDHAAKFVEAVEEVRGASHESTSDAPSARDDDADGIAVAFQAKMLAHARVLEALEARSAPPVLAAKAATTATLALSGSGSDPETTDDVREHRGSIASLARRTAESVSTRRTVAFDTDTSALAARSAASSVEPEASPVAMMAFSVATTDATAESANQLTIQAESDERELSSAYVEKHAAVAELIASTSEAFDRSASVIESAATLVKDDIVGQARQALDGARESLDEADRAARNGDEEAAFSALLKAERSAHEAATALEAGLRLDADAERNERRSLRSKGSDDGDAESENIKLIRGERRDSNKGRGSSADVELPAAARKAVRDTGSTVTDLLR